MQWGFQKAERLLSRIRLGYVTYKGAKTPYVKDVSKKNYKNRSDSYNNIKVNILETLGLL